MGAGRSCSRQVLYLTGPGSLGSASCSPPRPAARFAAWLCHCGVFQLSAKGARSWRLPAVWHCITHRSNSFSVDQAHWSASMALPLWRCQPRADGAYCLDPSSSCWQCTLHVEAAAAQCTALGQGVRAHVHFCTHQQHAADRQRPTWTLTWPCISSTAVCRGTHAASTAGS